MPDPTTTAEQRARIRELEWENNELCQANEILKDALGFFAKKTEEVKTSELHLFIMAYRNIYLVSLMCHVLKVSESGYYRWLRNREKQSSRRLLLVRIKEILAEHPDNDNYGVRGMRIALRQSGIDVSLRTVYHTMRKADCFIRRDVRTELLRLPLRFKSKRIC